MVLTSGGKNSAKDRLSFVCGHALRACKHRPLARTPDSGGPVRMRNSSGGASQSVIRSSCAQKTVLIICADFAPSSYPQALRTRFFARHLPEFGWKPLILTTEPRFYEWSVDPENEKLLPPDSGSLSNTRLPCRDHAQIWYRGPWNAQPVAPLGGALSVVSRAPRGPDSHFHSPESNDGAWPAGLCPLWRPLRH